MLGSRNLPLDTPQNVSYPHQVIINNIRKVVSWKFVRLEDDRIALVLRDVVNKVSINQVIERLTPIAELESDAIFIVFRNLFSNLFWSEISKKGRSDYNSI